MSENENSKNDLEDILNNDELSSILEDSMKEDTGNSSTDDIDTDTDNSNVSTDNSNVSTDNNSIDNSSSTGNTVSNAKDNEDDKLDEQLSTLDKITTIMQNSGLVQSSSGTNNNGSTEDDGSGNLDVDISNWFQGTDAIPSNNLNNYISNSSVKMSYGLSRSTLANYEMMGKLRDFISEAIPSLFDKETLLTLEPDDMKQRLQLAFAMYKELSTLNQRTYISLSEMKHKYNEVDGEIDKLTMLLSSIPTDKLESLLTQLTQKTVSTRALPVNKEVAQENNQDVVADLNSNTTNNDSNSSSDSSTN